MEQLVARRAHNPKVVGSSPSPATKKTRYTVWCSEFFLVIAECFVLSLSGYETEGRISRGDVATASRGRNRERKEAPRSKFIGAPSRYELWAPQEVKQTKFAR